MAGFLFFLLTSLFFSIKLRPSSLEFALLSAKGGKKRSKRTAHGSGDNKDHPRSEAVIEKNPTLDREKKRESQKCNF